MPQVMAGFGPTVAKLFLLSPFFFLLWLLLLLWLFYLIWDLIIQALKHQPNLLVPLSFSGAESTPAGLHCSKGSLRLGTRAETWLQC